MGFYDVIGMGIGAIMLFIVAGFLLGLFWIIDRYPRKKVNLVDSIIKNTHRPLYKRQLFLNLAI